MVLSGSNPDLHVDNRFLNRAVHVRLNLENAGYFTITSIYPKLDPRYSLLSDDFFL